MKQLEQFEIYVKNLNWEMIQDEIIFWFFMVVVIGGLFFRILYVVFVTSKNVSKKKAKKFHDPMVEEIMKKKPNISHEKAHALAEAAREQMVHAQEAEDKK